MQAHLRQQFLNLVERLPAEERRAKHLRFSFLDQFADVGEVIVLETVGRAHNDLPPPALCGAGVSFLPASVGDLVFVAIYKLEAAAQQIQPELTLSLRPYIARFWQPL